MHRRLRTLFAVLVAGVGLLVVNVAPASASSSHSQWVPDGPYPDQKIQACRTTLTISDVVNKVQTRERTNRNGDTRTDFRGTYIVKVSAPDGRRAVLNNSGSYSIFDYANGDQYVPISAPGLIYPFDDDEAAVFRAAGLPKVFYFTKGHLELYTHDGVEQVIRKPRNPTSICTLLH